MTKIALMMLAGATVSTAAFADNTAMSRDEVRSMVSEMMADAETRSSLLQGGGMAGYDGGFKVGSADGNWTMKVNGLIQFRYINDFRDKDNLLTGNDDYAHGFQMRKARMTFSGNAVNPNLTYFFSLEDSDTSDNAGTWSTNDLYFAYNLENGWSIRGGQYKGRFLKEELMSEKTTLSMERGVMNRFFNQGRTQGVGAYYTSNDFRWGADFTDGMNAANTDVTATSSTSGQAEYAFGGRGEWKFAGSWETLDSGYTSKPGDASANALGVALTSQRIGTEPAASENFFGATADYQWQGNGWSFFAAVAYANTGNTVGSDFTDWGGTAQVGYRWSETSEVFAKWDGLFLDGDRFTGTTGDDTKNYLTVGYNHYFAGNAAKLTIDCIYAFNDGDFGGGSTSLSESVVPNGATDIGSGIGLNGSSDDGEFAIRAQFQLAF